MGVDAWLQVKYKGKPFDKYEAEDHSGGCRLYDHGYERGPWPQIAQRILELWGDEDVETVFYYGDNEDELAELTPQRFNEINLHWIQWGHRPYTCLLKKGPVPVRTIAESNSHD